MDGWMAVSAPDAGLNMIKVAVSCLLRKAGRAFDRRASNGSSCGAGCGEGGGRRGLKKKGLIDAGWRVMGAASRIPFTQLVSEGRNWPVPLPYLCCARWAALKLAQAHGRSAGSCDFELAVWQSQRCTSPSPRGGAPTALRPATVTAGAPLARASIRLHQGHWSCQAAERPVTTGPRPTRHCRLGTADSPLAIHHPRAILVISHTCDGMRCTDGSTRARNELICPANNKPASCI
jgi:hypothetical protein